MQTWTLLDEGISPLEQYRSDPRTLIMDVTVDEMVKAIWGIARLAESPAHIARAHAIAADEFRRAGRRVRERLAREARAARAEMAANQLAGAEPAALPADPAGSP